MRNRITLGDFTIKKNEKGNLYSTENGLSKNETWSAADNHNQYVCHICAKGFLASKFNKQLLTKYQIFTKLPQISHNIHKNRNFSSIIEKRLINCFYCIKFMAGTCKESTFFVFIFASCKSFRVKFGLDMQSMMG